MARLARVVVPGLAHHLTQRGNRRQRTFFSDDYALYRRLLAASCRRFGIAVWAYCLMPNHVHLIVVPNSTESLRPGIGDAHRRYSRHVNFREGWRGYLWQGRFGSFPLEGAHLLTAARYVELNPVRARLVARAEDWPWSSARAHLAGADDELACVAPLGQTIGNWQEFLTVEPADAGLATIRRHQRTGRPLGDDAFVDRLEARLARKLRPGKPGPKPASDAAGAEIGIVSPELSELECACFDTALAPLGPTQHER
jgi:putative transposase